MILTIANTDFTSLLDATKPARITRKLYQAEQFEAWLLLAEGASAPSVGSRVIVTRNDGHKLFTGYLATAPTLEPLGFGISAPAFRAQIIAIGDQSVLDRKPLPSRPPFTQRTAGATLRQITQDIAPGSGPQFDTSAIQDVATLSAVIETKSKRWSDCAKELAFRARSVFRVHDGHVSFAPAGTTSYSIEESSPKLITEALVAKNPSGILNDAVVIGLIEPGARCKDYFQGDGLTLSFNLAHQTFQKYATTVFQDEYVDGGVDPKLWSTADPASALSTANGSLGVNGGTGTDGQTLLQFVEQLELGGVITLQHGDVSFTAPSTGVIGGLSNGAPTLANCMAGFKLTPASGQTQIQPIIHGSAAGTPFTTVATHRTLLTTRIYATEVFRTLQEYRSSISPPAILRGGGVISADIRVVLEIHDVDPASPGTQAAPGVVLYDGVITNAPTTCTYAVINAASMFCQIAFTRMVQEKVAEVRSTIPAFATRSRAVGLGSEGAVCNITTTPVLQFASPSVPVPGESIVVRYRGQRRAAGRATFAGDFVWPVVPGDDGVRAACVKFVSPPARTTPECISAALSFLDDMSRTAWTGSYTVLSDLLPSGSTTDPLPGDAVQFSAPTYGANFNAILREVDLEVVTLEDDRFLCKLSFANDSASALARETSAAVPGSEFDQLTSATVYAQDLPDAEVITITSTTVTIDAGIAPGRASYFEVRRSDSNWGTENDRNLAGRFNTQQFTVPRLARIQDFYVSYVDGSGTTPIYSLNPTALHIDVPL